MADHETRKGHRQTIKGYMAAHQHDPNANNLWTYFQNVLNWAITNFDMKKFKKIMKGLWRAWIGLGSTTNTAQRRSTPSPLPNASRLWCATARYRDRQASSPTSWQATSDISTSAPSPRTSSLPPGKGRTTFARYAARSSTSSSWKATTSLLGAKADEPSSRTARCFAENVIEGKERNKYGENPQSQQRVLYSACTWGFRANRLSDWGQSVNRVDVFG